MKNSADPDQFASSEAFKKDSCQFLAKECAQVLVNHSED